MKADAAPEFDMGPLSWVAGEIGQSLARGLDSLATFRAAPSDTTSLKHARNHVHQAAGAIQMVGLEAVGVYTDEIERQLSRLEDLDAAGVGQACAVIDQACRKLKIFVDELVGGAPPVPLKLFPEYEAMQRLRGIKAAAPTDLFFPELGRRAPGIETPLPPPPNKLASHLVKQRRLYEGGLLKFLRGDAEGAPMMREAVAGIERVSSRPGARTFWWTVGAFFDAINEHGLEAGFGAKQLAARLDLQIRRVVEGSAKVANRLRREVLYYVAVSAPVAPSVLAVQKGFRLAGLIPSAEVLNADLVRREPILREAREQLGATKDLWLKVTSGRADSLPKLKQTLVAAHRNSVEIGNGALMKLLASLVARLDKMPPSGSVSEQVAMEYATALLLAESAVAHSGSRVGEFPKQVEAMLTRLDAAQASRPIPAGTAPMLDEMFQRAQERVLLAQVAREIQTNLRRMEQVLDAFFRDHAKSAELATLAKDSQQVRGALQMLGQDDAARLLGLCQDQIESYAHPDAAIGDEDLELLAESLSGLGFFVEALEQQRPDRDRLIAPLLAKRLGEVPAAPVDGNAETVEGAVEELRGALPLLVAEVHRAPTDAIAQAVLKGKLNELLNDAKLIDDGELVTQAEAALAELEAGGGTVALAAAVTAIAESGDAMPAPAPALSEETQRLLATDATNLDAELLDIYLTEAAEVLETIAANRAELAQSPGDREALRTVRRQFHTLKGSGRMVGLIELGEIAFDVERIHNSLLEEESPVTRAVLTMIEVAEREFRHWIAVLRDTRSVIVDPDELRAAIGAVEAELPSAREPAARARARLAAAAPAVAVPTPPVVAAPTVPAVGAPPAPEVVASPVPEVVATTVPVVAAPTAPEVFAEAAPEVADAEPEVVAESEWEIMDVVPGEAAGAPSEGVSAAEPAFPEWALAVPAEAARGEVAEPEPEGAETAPDGADAVVSDGVANAAEFVVLAELGGAPAEAAPGVAPATVDAGLDVDGGGAEFVEFAAVGEMPITAELPADELAPVGEVSATAERPADELASVGEAPVTAELAADEIMSPVEDEVAPPDEDVTIGDVTMSTVLYHLLIDEAETHLATLDRELSLLQFDPKQRPSAAMVRASHTLCGIHRTSGIPLIATTAKALEQCLLALQQAVEPLPAVALPVLAGAVDILAELVARVRERAGFTAAATKHAGMIQQELEALGRAATAEPMLLDAEILAAHEAATDDRAAAGVSGEPDERTADGMAPTTMAGAARREPAAVPEPVAFGAAPDEVPATAREGRRRAVIEPQPATEGALAGEVESAAAPQDPLSDIRDDVDEQVLPIFLEEAADLCPEAGEQVRAWRRAPDDAASARQLRRTLHTLKGSARMAGAMRLGELAHLTESRLVVDDEPVAGTPELFDALDADLDRIAYVLDALREGKTDVPLTPSAADVQIAAAPDEAVPVAPESPAFAPERPVVVPLAPVAGAPRHAAAAVAATAEVEAGARAMLRVRADIVDALANEAGETAITRARIEGELRALKANLLELTGSVVRLRALVREIEIQAESQIQSRLMQVGEHKEGFDPLEFDRYTRFQELARSLAEGVNDVSTVQQSLLKNHDVVDAALIAQAHLSRDMQQQLFAIRTVPFGSVSERMYRILRATAHELDKRANLEIHGATTELDRSVLEKLSGPLEHLLRNAVDHGIESRGARRSAGKTETGEITLTARQVGNEIVIELTDDGAGLNLDRIRERAVAQGRIAPDARPTDDQLVNFIFEPGLSTASRVTQVSGRGIGMDVVRAEIAALGGSIEVSTARGRGTTFVLSLPLTLAVAQAVLVRAGGRLWALPAAMVEQVQQVKPEALVNLYVQRHVEWQGLSYPFHYLPRLLGDSHQIPESARSNPVLLLRSGQGVAAVHVDEMVGNQEVVVKNIGPQLARVSGIAGATILGNGEIVLIINPVQLAQRAEVPVFEPDAEGIAPEVPKMAPVQTGRPLVMIVDDSLTVRKITSRLLGREGFDVIAAKDGVDALLLLDTETPDLILLDIEMPRMDGFEFTRTIKSDADKARIPIVMITSRMAEKHRNRAKELGVDLYLGKPFQEDELLRHLREMLALTA